MTRTEVIYGQLDQVLRSLSFSCWMSRKEPPARGCEHNSTALLSTPPFPMDGLVLENHLVAARTTLDLIGTADPKVFDAKL